MKKILLIQSRSRPDMVEKERMWYQRAARESAQFEFISTLDDTQAWDDPARITQGFDAVMIGGSSDFDYDGGRNISDPMRVGARGIFARIDALVRYVIENEIPFLGVCFGHQILAEIYGGAVAHDQTQKKMGSYEVSVTDEGTRDALFASLSQKFFAQYAHRDSITALPKGAVLLGSGGSCRFSALRYGRKAYTFQFHPEVGAPEILAAAKYASEYLPAGISVESVVKESPEASRIIPRFIDKVVGV